MKENESATWKRESATRSRERDDDTQKRDRDSESVMRDNERVAKEGRGQWQAAVSNAGHHVAARIGTKGADGYAGMSRAARREGDKVGWGREVRDLVRRDGGMLWTRLGRSKSSSSTASSSRSMEARKSLGLDPRNTLRGQGPSPTSN
ncbi:hypothetical protein BD410DRAFT_877348 [Rickenella mellea]|uniref:Uncharacterized protein n=1 Tax=Rickenella mellea TaxID=50990 RepID=A0A4Y7PVE0_9AGAM|nr:hypothetical protein BD410DRAFT_877348 [Rickenella mellea]